MSNHRRDRAGAGAPDRGRPEERSGSAMRQLSRRELTGWTAAATAALVGTSTDSGAASGTAASVAAAPRGNTRRSGSARLSADDRFAILELIARYAWAYDCSDPEEFVATFVADGAIVPFGGAPIAGHAALRGFVAGLIKERGDNDWQHVCDHHRFEGDARACTVYSFYTMFEGQRAERQFRVRSMGYYRSECVKVGGEWYFRRRDIQRWNGAQLPWK